MGKVHLYASLAFISADEMLIFNIKHNVRLDGFEERREDEIKQLMTLFDQYAAIYSTKKYIEIPPFII